jgi:DNA segregation ATPase FtsK/SpoIIIE-like protein
MARTQTTRRAAPARASRSKAPAPSQTRRLVRAIRRLLTFSRPRTVAEGLALLFVVLAIATFGVLAVGDLMRHRGPGIEVTWSLPILGGALAARFFPWWRDELDRMTAERARHLAGSALLAAVALSLCIHLLSVNLGISRAYPFLGPLSAPPVSIAVLIGIALIGFSIIVNLPLKGWLAAAWQRTTAAIASARQPRVLQSTALDEPRPYFAEIDRYEPDGVPFAEAGPNAGVKTRTHTAPVAPSAPAPILPPIETFAPAAKRTGPALDLDQVAARIEETLASFGVRARVVGHHSGPVVTQFDIQPDRGVKVKSITSLQNDLALALAAPTIRIQAPVPGKPVVGIEIPNSAATTVSLRELLESEAYQTLKSPLAVVLGKDVAGASAVIDLGKMPHLLIAGATGSGKSVCVNALISCLLYRNTPDDVRLMMIDPKMVELTVYNGVPHLLAPVVTQMDKVVGVLQWAIREMERRYQLFADHTVRNIGRYNEKMQAAGKARLPYIVLIIDELADLMMVAPEDTEEAVCRLAQLARAAGIHLVIATQRPSVDVITGLIKANFPARIAFAMTSQVDSRTILDTSGAEKLLGRGDMLYMPPDAPKPVRLQGAFLSDQEIEQLVEFWKRSPLLAATQRIAAEEFVAAEKSAAEAGDDLLEEATRVVREFQHASVSLLQRRLRIGYARAARLMDQLEQRGVVGTADGSKQRPVLPVEDSAVSADDGSLV